LPLGNFVTPTTKILQLRSNYGILKLIFPKLLLLMFGFKTVVDFADNQAFYFLKGAEHRNIKTNDEFFSKPYL